MFLFPWWNWNSRIFHDPILILLILSFCGWCHSYLTSFRSYRIILFAVSPYLYLNISASLWSDIVRQGWAETVKDEPVSARPWLKIALHSKAKIFQNTINNMTRREPEDLVNKWFSLPFIYTKFTKLQSVMDKLGYKRFYYKLYVTGLTGSRPAPGDVGPTFYYCIENWLHELI